MMVYLYHRVCTVFLILMIMKIKRAGCFYIQLVLLLCVYRNGI
jgi:hypothetical protein